MSSSIPVKTRKTHIQLKAPPEQPLRLSKLKGLLPPSSAHPVAVVPADDGSERWRQLHFDLPLYNKWMLSNRHWLFGRSSSSAGLSISSPACSCASIIDWLQQSLRHIPWPLNDSSVQITRFGNWKKRRPKVSFFYIFSGENNISPCYGLLLHDIGTLHFIWSAPTRSFKQCCSVELNPWWWKLKCVQRRKHCTGNGDDGAVYCAGYRRVIMKNYKPRPCFTMWRLQIGSAGWMALDAATTTTLEHRNGDKGQICKSWYALGISESRSELRTTDSLILNAFNSLSSSCAEEARYVSNDSRTEKLLFCGLSSSSSQQHCRHGNAILHHKINPLSPDLAVIFRSQGGRAIKCLHSQFVSFAVLEKTIIRDGEDLSWKCN